jgi:hypothetical protein
MLLVALHFILRIICYIYFNFAPLHVLRLGRVPHLPDPCYGSAVQLLLLSSKVRKVTSEECNLCTPNRTG